MTSISFTDLIFHLIFILPHNDRKVVEKVELCWQVCVSVRILLTQMK